MREKASIEIKQYAASHRKQGRTLAEIQNYLHMKGYDVCIETVNRWIGEVSNIKDSYSDCSRYADAVKYQNMKQNLFERVKPGSPIVAKIQKHVEEEDGKILMKDVEARVIVTEKYTHFLVCTDGIHKFCVDKMDIVSI